MGIAETKAEFERAKSVLLKFYGATHPETSKPIDEQISSIIDMLVRTRAELGNAGAAAKQAEEQRRAMRDLRDRCETLQARLTKAEEEISEARQAGIRALGSDQTDERSLLQMIKDLDLDCDAEWERANEAEGRDGEQKDKLWEVCTKWVQEHKVLSAECAYQSDSVNLAAPELVIAIGDIVGYVECQCDEAEGAPAT